MNVNQKICLVTGANRGLGLGAVELLLQKGYAVILTARVVENGENAFKKLKARYEDVFFHQLDVADIYSIQKCRDFCQHEFGKLDVLINNAGIDYDLRHSVHTADLDDCRQIMEVNLFGAWMVAQQFWPLLKNSSHPRIVNVSSGAGSISNGEGGTPGYSISKAAMNMLTVKLAKAGEAYSILTNSVCPGWVRTAMGGPQAPRSIEEGASSIVWAAEIPDDGPSGGFYRDGVEISW